MSECNNKLEFIDYQLNPTSKTAQLQHVNSEDEKHFQYFKLFTSLKNSTKRKTEVRDEKIRQQKRRGTRMGLMSIMDRR
jgi:hypothetical protein